MHFTELQFARLDDIYRRQFPDQVAAYVRDQYADCLVRSARAGFAVAQIPDDVLRRLVRVGLHRAQGHGLTWQSTLNSFVTLMFIVAPNFDEHPKVASALAADGRPPNFRMLELPPLIEPIDWQQAAAAYDPHAWLGSELWS